MALKQPGLDIVLMVEDPTTPGTFLVLGGQQNTSFDGDANVVDTTDKSNAGWNTSTTTTRSGNVSVDGQLTVGDEAFAAIFTAWQSSQPINCRVVLNKQGGVVEGPYVISTFQISGGATEVQSYSVSLSLQGAPTEAKLSA